VKVVLLPLCKKEQMRKDETQGYYDEKLNVVLGYIRNDLDKDLNVNIPKKHDLRT
jgi:hypothetical protein